MYHSYLFKSLILRQHNQCIEINHSWQKQKAVQTDYIYSSFLANLAQFIKIIAMRLYQDTLLGNLNQIRHVNSYLWFQELVLVCVHGCSIPTAFRPFNFLEKYFQ